MRDLAEARSPLALMAEALALADCGARGPSAKIDSVRVVNILSWPSADRRTISPRPSARRQRRLGRAGEAGGVRKGFQSAA